MTIIGSLPRVILRFDRLGSGHYRATTGETQHRTCYRITRVDHRLWLAEMVRQQPDGTCDLVARNTVSVLKIAMRWCDDAARAEGALRPLTTIYWPVPGHTSRQQSPCAMLPRASGPPLHRGSLADRRKKSPPILVG
jgi:hypothetical protein